LKKSLYYDARSEKHQIMKYYKLTPVMAMYRKPLYHDPKWQITLPYDLPIISIY